MKSRAARFGRLCVLYGVLVIALVYSALALNVTPAYAAACTPTQCSEAYTDALTFCGGAGRITYFACPIYAGSDEWIARCVNGEQDVELCGS
jgi:hypothetical protein